MACLNARPETQCWTHLPRPTRAAGEWPAAPAAELGQPCVAIPGAIMVHHVARPRIAPGPGYRQRYLSGRGWWMERMDAAQPVMLTPDSSVPQREASISPITTCDCNSPPGRAGAKVSGEKKWVHKTK